MTAKTKGSKKKLDLRPIYDEVSKMLLIKNPEQISFSSVSQKTRVPRTTLYYYFSSDIDSLVLESVRHTMREFMQLWQLENENPLPEFSNWEALQKYKFLKAIEFVEKSPYALKLYFRFCSHPGVIGEEIRTIEKMYLSSTSKDWQIFYKTPLNEKLQQLLAQMKLGILWGLLGETNKWRQNEEELAQTCTRVFAVFSDIARNQTT